MTNNNKNGENKVSVKIQREKRINDFLFSNPNCTLQESMNFVNFLLSEEKKELRNLKIVDENGQVKDDLKYEISDVEISHLEAYVKKKRKQIENWVGVSKHGTYNRFPRLSNKRFEKEKKLNLNEMEKIIKLMTVTKYDKPFSSKELMEIWGCKKDILSRVIKRLTGKEILIPGEKNGKEKTYFVNQKIFFSGAPCSPNPAVEKDKDVKIYTKKLKEVIEKVEKIESEICEKVKIDSMKHSAISTLYLLFQNVHHQTLEVCENPLEKITEGAETIIEAYLRSSETKGKKIKYISHRSLIYRNEIFISKLDILLRDLFILEQAGALYTLGSTIQLNPELVWCNRDSYNDHKINELVKYLKVSFTKIKDAQEELEERRAMDPRLKLIIKEMKKAKLKSEKRRKK